MDWMAAITPLPWHDRMLVASMAIIANFLLGQRFILEAIPRGLYPSRWEQKLIASLEARLNKSGRSGGKLQVRGLFVLAYPVFAALAVGLYFSPFAGHGKYHFLLDVVMIGLAIRWRYVLDLSRYAVSQHQDVTLDQLRRYLQPMSVASTDRQDMHGIFRLCAEEGALAFAERLIGVTLWYLLLGLPGALAALAIIEAHAMLGAEARDLRAFGACTRAVYQVMFTLPLWLAGLFLAAGTLGVPRARIVESWTAALNPAHPPRHHLLKVMAEAAGLQLGGSQRILGQATERPWLGRGELKPDFYHINIALGIQSVAVLLWLLVLGSIFYFS